MRCPIHNLKMKKSKWEPPDGLDYKMERYACMACSEYWYKAPKFKLKRRIEDFITLKVD